MAAGSSAGQRRTGEFAAGFAQIVETLRKRVKTFGGLGQPDGKQRAGNKSKGDALDHFHRGKKFALTPPATMPQNTCF